MSILGSLAAFGLRQVLGDGVGNAAVAVQHLFQGHSQTLPSAIRRAHDRAWQSRGVALGGDGLLDRIQVLFSSGGPAGLPQPHRVLPRLLLTLPQSRAHSVHIHAF